jgi:hypothetical protein
MAQWTGKLFVFKDEQGCDQISLTSPAGAARSTIRVYQVSGPYVPIQNSASVDDAALWLEMLQRQGFTFARFAG